jgi:hypothetical protein
MFTDPRPGQRPAGACTPASATFKQSARLADFRPGFSARPRVRHLEAAVQYPEVRAWVTTMRLNANDKYVHAATISLAIAMCLVSLSLSLTFVETMPPQPLTHNQSSAAVTLPVVCSRGEFL